MSMTVQPQPDRPEPTVIAAQNDAFRKLACLGVPPAQPIQGRMHVTDGSTCQIVTATHYRRGRQKRRCYRIEETGGLVRLSKASLAGSELLSSAKGAASPVLAEFLAGQGG